MTRLVLASASPRRRELLGRLGLPFDIRPTTVDETPGAGEDARVLVRRLALAKAQAGLDAEAGRPPDPDVVVLGADTVVALGDRVLGKPVDEADAAAMLRALSGSRHHVLTGVAVASTQGTAASLAVEVAETVVVMRELTDAEIAGWIATGEALDKAGGYAIQELGDAFVERIEGSFDNVVGLPLGLVRRMLGAVGLEVGQPPEA